MAQPAELTLHLTRLLPAPRPRVFGACTKPEELAKWWGPQGFTVPSIDFAPRVGSSYRIAMQPPDGELFHLAGEFRHVKTPKLASMCTLEGLGFPPGSDQALRFF